MECNEIVEPSVALEIMRNPGDRLLQKRLIDCIYSEFCETIVRRLLGKFRGFCTEEDIRDAFQIAVTEFYIYCQKDEFVLNSTLFWFLYKICFYYILNKIKKDRFIDRKFNSMDWFEQSDDEENGGEGMRGEPFEITLPEFRYECLLNVVDMLPPRQRIVIILKFFGELSANEIAKKLGIVSGSVDNLVSNAYKKLRDLYETHCNSKNKKP